MSKQWGDVIIIPLEKGLSTTCIIEKIKGDKHDIITGGKIYCSNLIRALNKE